MRMKGATNNRIGGKLKGNMRKGVYRGCVTANKQMVAEGGWGGGVTE